MGSPVVGAGITAGTDILKIAIGLLAQHTARLKNAKDENSALDALVPAFDADLAEIAQAYETGEYSAPDCIAALLAVDQQSSAYLRSLVGKPGTAWTSAPLSSQIGTGNRPSYSADCNKTCTVSCCVYLNDLRPAIFGRVVGGAYGPYQTGNGYVLGLIEILQKGGGVLKVIPVAPPPHQYGTWGRAAYTIDVKAPSPAAILKAKVTALTSPPPPVVLASGVVLGGGAAATATTVSEAIADGSGQIVSPDTPASAIQETPASPLSALSGLSSNNWFVLAIVALLFLFGYAAVNR